jgi:hypothetical protein
MKDIPNIPTKYIILIWIILLILFTFYCIFRLWYISKPPTKNIPSNSNSNTRINKFIDTPVPLGTSINAIQYANNILTHDNVNDIAECKNMFDDNYGVRALGYNNCTAANADYISKGLDSSKLYGQPKSLNDLCPITAKNPVYMNCMSSLLNKFNANANIFQGVNNDMTDSINKRLHDRSDILNDIQLDMSSYIANNDIMNFKAQTGILDDSNKTNDTKLYEASIYYKGKYSSVPQSASNYSNPNTILEGFYVNTKTILTVDPYIVSTFFGEYNPIKGQYIAFNKLIITLNFDESSLTRITANDTNANTGSVILTITDIATNGTIVYNINNIANYEGVKNAIAIDISGKTVNVIKPSDDQALQQLLMVLGITVPSKLIITLKEVTNDLGTTRWSYNLMNINMDTIMVMKKKGDK